MKKNKRVAALLTELSMNPNKIYPSKYFCSKFDIAKSSLSEDIRVADEIAREMGRGHIETIPGVGGGIKLRPGISLEDAEALQNDLCSKLSDPTRILGGGFLYTSDIMFDSHTVRDMALIFAHHFRDVQADYIATVETKGIPLGEMTSLMLNIPMVVVRREPKYSEGSTVSINYFSGSYERIQKMSISKRAVKNGSSAIIIDDFMRGGGSLKGLTEILSEFNIDVKGAGVAMASREPEKKKISSYFPIIYLEDIDEEERVIKASPNPLKNWYDEEDPQ